MRMQANCEELIGRIKRALPDDGITQPLPGVYLARASLPMERVHSVVKPSFCVIAQGSKEVLLGESSYRYDSSHYLTLHHRTAPFQSGSGSIQGTTLSKFSPGSLPPALVGSVMVEAGQTALPDQSNLRAMDVSILDVALQDAVLRLVRLLDSPTDARVLMPLNHAGDSFFGFWRRARGPPSPSGDYGRLHFAHCQSCRAAQSRLLTNHLESRISGARVRNGVSGLHHHFKPITAMSPLQFQKTSAAPGGKASHVKRRPRCDKHGLSPVDITTPAHFNREYKSVFGVPPMARCTTVERRGLESPV